MYELHTLGPYILSKGSTVQCGVSGECSLSGVVHWSKSLACLGQQKPSQKLFKIESGFNTCMDRKKES